MIDQDIRNFGLSMGDGACFIKSDGFNLRQGFQVYAALDQDAVAGGPGNAGDNTGGSS